MFKSFDAIQVREIAGFVLWSFFKLMILPFRDLAICSEGNNLRSGF